MSRSERRWLGLVAGALVAASAILFAIHYVLFRDAYNLFFYMVHSIALIPLNVLIVGLFIERILSRREKQSLAHKLNMVIGTFFSEMGAKLLTDLLPAIEGSAEMRDRLHLQATWKKDDFAAAHRYAHDLPCKVTLDSIDLKAFRSYLHSERDFMLRLLENPNLMEHERFTDMLWALVHIGEELDARANVTTLSSGDKAHLALDIRRVYSHLLAEWILYAQHLKADYPYLFSLVCRTHPFQEAPSAELPPEEEELS